MIKHTIRGRYTVILVLLMAGTVFTSILINNLYYEKYYFKYKQNMIEDSVEKIKNRLEDDNRLSDDSKLSLRRLCEDYNISMAIIEVDIDDSNTEEQPDWFFSFQDYLNRNITQVKALYAYGNEQELIKLIGDYIYDQRDGVVEQIDNGAGHKINRTYDSRMQAYYMECFSQVGSNIYVCMRTPIQNIKENVDLANKFYGYIAIGITVAGAVIAYFLTREMTKPILKLARISEQMANLDFTIKYDGKEKNEIGVLGKSINYMSMQLEKKISELKAANIELQKDIEKKEQIDEMRKEFLSNVSHELKTPIALIQGYAEGLKECINDDPESNEFYCEVIMDEADKMNKMVKKLLTLNQIEFGNDQMNLEHFDLVQLINGVINNYQIMIRQREATLLFDTAEPVFVWADEFMIEEVISNYISNAFNHLDEKKLIIIRIEEKGDTARVSVTNTGEQIPEDEVDKVWIKFYKVDKARTREYGGSGIGLSIVKAIMDSHNRQCGVYNEVNGVTFWFELDARRE